MTTPGKSANGYADETPIVAVNMVRREVLLQDGRSVPFHDMFDDQGDPTDDIDSAASATVRHPDNQWAMLLIDLTQYEVMTLH